jgi:hypothetical protein
MTAQLRGTIIKTPDNGPGGLCMKHAKPLCAAGEFCIACGIRNTPVTAK